MRKLATIAMAGAIVATGGMGEANAATPAAKSTVAFVAKGRVSGTIYQDKNHSGTRNAGEKAVGKAQVKLTNLRTGAVRITKSSARGYYSFGKLRAGTYRVSVRHGKAKLVSVSSRGRATVNVGYFTSKKVSKPVNRRTNYSPIGTNYGSSSEVGSPFANGCPSVSTVLAYANKLRAARGLRPLTEETVFRTYVDNAWDDIVRAQRNTGFYSQETANAIREVGPAAAIFGHISGITSDSAWNRYVLGPGMRYLEVGCSYSNDFAAVFISSF